MEENVAGVDCRNAACSEGDTKVGNSVIIDTMVVVKERKCAQFYT
jgi:hypothetical protein